MLRCTGVDEGCHLVVDWRLKSVAHRAVSLLPNSRGVNRLLQRRVSRSVRFDGSDVSERVRSLVDRQISPYSAHAGVSFEGSHVVEMGNDWHLLVPLAVVAWGAASVVAVDPGVHLGDAEVNATVEVLVDVLESDGSLRIDHHRMELLRQFRRTRAGVRGLADLGITVHADPRVLGQLTPASADVALINNVLEHVAPEAITALYRTIGEIVRPGGLLMARIDMSDHFRRVDPAIGPFNFLRYSDRAWRWLQSPMEPQNRIRRSEYLSLLAEAGWQLVEDVPESGDLEALNTVSVHPRFQHLSMDDLLTTVEWVIARRGGAVRP